MEIIDVSSEPRRLNELFEARVAIKREIVRGTLQPILVFYPTIIDALTELIQLRLAENVEEE